MKVPSTAPIIVAALAAEVALTAPVVNDDLVHAEANGAAMIERDAGTDEAPSVAEQGSDNTKPRASHPTLAGLMPTMIHVDRKDLTPAEEKLLKDVVKRAGVAVGAQNVPTTKVSVSLLTPTTATAPPPSETCTEAADGQIQCNPTVAAKRDVDIDVVTTMSAVSGPLPTETPPGMSCTEAADGQIQCSSTVPSFHPTGKVEVRAKDETPCIAEANCGGYPSSKSSAAASSTTPPPPPPPTATLPTTAPTTTVTEGTSGLPVLTPLTFDPFSDGDPSGDWYCWEADNGQVHCVWTVPPGPNKAKRTAAPEPVAGSLLEREAPAVPTTLVTAVKREDDTAAVDIQPRGLPRITKA